MKDYFELLPINREITFKGVKLIVRSVWNRGAVLKTEDDDIVCLIGQKDLKEVSI